MHRTEVVRRVADVGMRDQATVGGKAASLGELIRAGIPVPPGCVVTTAAFASSLAALDPDGAIPRDIEALDADDSVAIGSVTAGIRDRVVRSPLPPQLRRAIGDAYRALGDDGVGYIPAAVAIRSSATSEDSPEASFAGLQDTFLWVRGEQSVLDYVRTCWASLYSVESVTYRRRHGLPERGLAMAVVVQRMIDARSAGVLFTRSPTTGDRSVIAVEGSWGLGSAVVSGEVTPDTYVVNKVTGEIVKRVVTTKRRRHRMDPAGTGVLAEDVPVHLQDEPCLRDDEIQQLRRLAGRVESHYQAPQDIEWAICDAPGQAGTFLLQSRPETAWARRESAPVATAKSRPAQHVFDMFGGQASTGRNGGAET